MICSNGPEYAPHTGNIRFHIGPSIQILEVFPIKLNPELHEKVTVVLTKYCCCSVGNDTDTAPYSSIGTEQTTE